MFYVVLDCSAEIITTNLTETVIRTTQPTMMQTHLSLSCFTWPQKVEGIYASLLTDSQWHFNRWHFHSNFLFWQILAIILFYCLGFEATFDPDPMLHTHTCICSVMREHTHTQPRVITFALISVWYKWTKMHSTVKTCLSGSVKCSTGQREEDNSHNCLFAYARTNS